MPCIVSRLRERFSRRDSEHYRSNRADPWERRHKDTVDLSYRRRISDYCLSEQRDKTIAAGRAVLANYFDGKAFKPELSGGSQESTRGSETALERGRRAVKSALWNSIGVVTAQRYDTDEIYEFMRQLDERLGGDTRSGS